MRDLRPSVLRTATEWARFALAQGSRFDVELKAALSIQFVLDAGGSTFAIPSKLEGTAQTQQVVKHLAKLQHLHLHHNTETQRVEAVTDRGEVAGRIQGKHLKWVLPLLPEIKCFVTAVTGRTQRYMGVNIVFTNVTTALDHYHSSVYSTGDSLPAEPASITISP